MMKDQNLKFLENDDYSSWVANWKRNQSQGKDVPMNPKVDQYNQNHQGKAMEFWAKIYQVTGENFFKKILAQSIRAKTISNEELVALLKEYKIPNPQDILPGWVTNGPYKKQRAEDFGPINFRLHDVVLDKGGLPPVIDTKNITDLKDLTGKAVWAEWKKDNWYRGKVFSKCLEGYMIHFDDGDKKCVTPDEVVVDSQPNLASLKANMRVIAKWKDQRFYRGKIGSIEGSKIFILFDDGDKLTVTVGDIRLINQ